MQETPLVYTIVLNWNSYNDTSSCLNSLKKINYDRFETIVVDNGSDDDSGKQIADEYSNIKVLFNGENAGFAGGMNTGIRHAINSGADYLFLLNNDTVIPDGQNLVQQLIQPLIENSNIGMTSPLITEYNTDRIWFVQAETNQQTINPKHIGEGKVVEDLTNNQSIVETDYIPLCAAMVDVDMLENVGLLNEQYFLYYEDIDYARRARNQGFKFITVIDVKVAHKISQSTGDNLGPLNSYYAARNRLLFQKEFNNDIKNIKFMLKYISWASLLIGNRIIHLQLQGLKALLRGIIDGLSSRDGRGPYP